MSDKEKTLFKVCLALLAIAVMFLILRRATGAASGPSYNIEGSSIGGANNPTTINATSPNNGNWENYFNSENNVNVNTFGLNELSQKYIPMFGLVGMTSVGNIVVQQNVTQEAAVGRMRAAPQQVYQATTQPYQGYMGNAPSLQKYGGMGSIGSEMQLRRAAKEGRLNQLLNS